MEALFERERRAGNLLTPEELQRLQAYVDKARAGQWFTEEEVWDYNRLVSALEREKPTDPGVWPLVALGDFLVGLGIGGGGQRRK